MGILSRVFGTELPLYEAAKNGPNAMGCYKLILNGRIVYVGKAEDGLRKRFVQYYNGTSCNYSSARKIHSYRDELYVSWTILDTPQQCRSVERSWIERYDPAWNVQSGWSHD